MATTDIRTTEIGTDLQVKIMLRNFHTDSGKIENFLWNINEMRRQEEENVRMLQS